MHIIGGKTTSRRRSTKRIKNGGSPPERVGGCAANIACTSAVRCIRYNALARQFLLGLHLYIYIDCT